LIDRHGARRRRAALVEKACEKRCAGERSWEFDVSRPGWRTCQPLCAIGRVLRRLPAIRSQTRGARAPVSRTARRRAASGSSTDLGAVIRTSTVRVTGGLRDHARVARSAAVPWRRASLAAGDRASLLRDAYAAAPSGVGSPTSSIVRHRGRVMHAGVPPHEGRHLAGGAFASQRETSRSRSRWSDRHPILVHIMNICGYGHEEFVVAQYRGDFIRTLRQLPPAEQRCAIACAPVRSVLPIPPCPTGPCIVDTDGTP
jgi:hypothetical protein